MKRASAVAILVAVNGAAAARIQTSVDPTGDATRRATTHRTGDVVLWDQSTLDTDSNALVDQVFGDFPTYASYMATDVTVEGYRSPSKSSRDTLTWSVTGVSTYFTRGFGNWPDAGTATLHISRIDGSNGTLPPNDADPSTGGDYGATGLPVTVNDLGDGVQEVRWDGTNIVLTAGRYAIGLSPEFAFGEFGQEYHYGAPIVGDNTPWRNPGGSFGLGSEWIPAYRLDATTAWEDRLDGAILVRGRVLPEPASVVLLVTCGFVSFRRR